MKARESTLQGKKVIRHACAAIAVVLMTGGALPLNAGEGATSDWNPGVRWRGFNLLGMFRAPTIGLASDPRVDGHFVEWEFKAVRDWGFNFVRLPIDYRILTKGDDRTNLDDEKMKRVDEGTGGQRVRHPPPSPRDESNCSTTFVCNCQGR